MKAEDSPKNTVPAKATESPQIEKAREKLKQKFKQEDEKITGEALNQMKKAINIWLGRHESERVKLENRVSEIGTNLPPEKTHSQFVKQLRSRLEEEANETESFRRLIGRVKKGSQDE